MTSLDELWHGKLKRPYRLHVSFEGSPEKPPMVLLHGIAASGEMWSKVKHSLRQDYFCITVDLIGSGQSPKPQWANYDMEFHIRSLLYTIRRLKISKRYILIGHSLGSFLATQIALSEKKRIKRLILLSPPVYPPIDSITNSAARRMTSLLMLSYRYLRSGQISQAQIKAIGRLMPFSLTIFKDTATWIPFLRTLEKCIEEQTILDDAKKLKVNTTVLYGTLDEVVVGDNVKLLEKVNPRISVKPFLGDHMLTGRYGKLVAETLKLPHGVVTPPRKTKSSRTKSGKKMTATINTQNISKGTKRKN